MAAEDTSWSLPTLIVSGLIISQSLPLVIYFMSDPSFAELKKWWRDDTSFA